MAAREPSTEPHWWLYVAAIVAGILAGALFGLCPYTYP